MSGDTQGPLFPIRECTGTAGRARMDFNAKDHCTIADALDDLARGDWRAFENKLWIGFGDRWEHVRSMLTQHQHIQLRGKWKDEPTLTERGQVLLSRLQARPQAAAS